jgi:hypothetical protein
MTVFNAAQYIGDKVLLDYVPPGQPRKQETAIVIGFRQAPGQPALHLVRPDDLGLIVPVAWIERMTRIHDR